MGLPTTSFLELRLEETAIGVAVAWLVLPPRTSERIRAATADVMAALGDLIEACRKRLAGEPGDDLAARARRLDRQLAALRGAQDPLHRGPLRALAGRMPGRDQRLLAGCGHYARSLAHQLARAERRPWPKALEQATARIGQS